MKGTPVYTQRSVAWPRNPARHDSELDDIGVSFDAKGGGTHGEFRFSWVEFTQPKSIWDYKGDGPKVRHPAYPHGALKIEVFSDAFGAILDDRIIDMLRVIARMQEKRRDMSPEKLIAMLEAAGVKPSQHHLRGRLEQNLYDGPAERRAIEREIARQQRREAA